MPSPITTSIASARLLKTLTSTCWPVFVSRTLIFSAGSTLGGEPRAQHRRDDVGRVRRREELALAHAAAGLGKELALCVRLDALGDHLEVHAARKGDERAREAGTLGFLRDAGDQLAVDADCARAQALQRRQR